MFSMVREIYRTRLTQDRRIRIKRYLAHHFRGTQSLVFGTLFGSDLTALAVCYGTDKAECHHYTDIYMRLFSPVRKRGLNILEIGVGGFNDPLAGGASLRMWRTYFPRGRIYGIDTFDKTPHDERRIKTFQGSQDDEQFLKAVVDQIGRLDIVIDDGSHLCAHIIKSFEVLFPRVAPGGFYIVEDTHTSYAAEYGGSVTNPDASDTSMGYFKKLVHAVNRREIHQANSAYASSEIEGMIYGIRFYENIIIVEKETAP